MLKRLLWLGVGVAVGVVVVRKLAKTAEAMSPGGIADRLRETAVTAGDSLRNFMADVSEGMAEKEAELQDALAEGRPIGELLEDPYDDHDDSGMGGTIR
ncbi:hypothetical protein FB566_0162 [Stackebrandtia endophytica]|uniref:Uncharacterized protein n=1 Tax=Stackebrandtia endophytica TaxID=1496996 RepID=A0A543AQ59_9ACTN|nr:DUF6167 family protein [Stackebrandtia endophytica]TQL74676.1 hypothetical protein FB566_0162 [Stackebrandtia endophytica]